MAKRRATDQITKDGGFARDESFSSEEEGGETQQQASADVMAHRKIAVPRSRLGNGSRPSVAPASASSPAPFASLASSNGTKSSQSSNPFASLSQTSSAQPSKPTSGNPFGFLKPTDSASTPKPATAAGSGFSVSTQGGSPAGARGHSSEELKLRGLNSSFAAKIAKANAESPFADWSHMCEKYVEYARKVANGTATDAALSKNSTPVPAETNPGTPQKEKEPAQGFSGFKFNAGPTSGATSFQFGDKKVEIKKTDVPSQPTGGFVFNANGKGEIRGAASGGAGDASASESKQQAGHDAKPVFSFGKTEGPAAENKPKFTFGSDAGKDKATAPLADASAQKSDAKQPFTFGKAGSGEPAQKPAFSFGAPNEDKSAKPAFSFGAPAAKDGEGAKPAFSFGAPAPASDGAKPAFSFGASNQSKPMFSFGGTAAPSDSGEGKPKFSFGGAVSQNTASGESKPAFSFGAKDGAKPSFTFGKKPDEAKSDDTKQDGAKPAFSFGAPSGPSAGLSLGSGVNPFGAAQSDNTWKPGSSVNIVSEENAGGAADAQTGSGEATGEPSEEQNDPQTDLGGPGPGEEDEECVYEKKAKLFELSGGEYKTLGLGMLRVLVHTQTKKSRVLLRAEGSGRVLLNVMLRREFSYSVVGKGQVKLVDVKAGTESPTVYVLRVKTEEDGKTLRDKLEEVKN